MRRPPGRRPLDSNEAPTVTEHRPLISGAQVAICYIVAFWSGFFVMGV